MVDLYYFSKKYLIPPTGFCLYKCSSRREILLSYLISCLFNLHFSTLIGFKIAYAVLERKANSSFPQRQRYKLVGTLSLFSLQMFRWGIHFIVPPVQTLTISKESNQPHWKFYSICLFFLELLTLRNRPPCAYFPQHYNPIFQIKCQSLYTSLILIIFTYYQLFFHLYHTRRSSWPF